MMVPASIRPRITGIFLLFLCQFFLLSAGAQEVDFLAKAEHYLGDQPDSTAYFLSMALRDAEDANDSARMYLRLAIPMRIYSFQSAIKWLDAISYSQLTDSSLRGQTALLYGFCYYGLGEYQQASKWYEEARPYFQDEPDTRWMIQQSLGKIYTRNGDYEQALSLYRLNEAYLLSIEDKRLLEEVYIEMGTAYRGQNDTLQAIASYQQALQVQGINDRNRGIAHSNLGHMFGWRQEWRLAEHHMEQANKLLEGLGEAYSHYLAESYHIQGDVFIWQGKHAQAYQAYLQAKSWGIPQWGSFSREAGKLHISLGDYFLIQGQLDSAMNHFQAALTYVLPLFHPDNNRIQPDSSLFYGENTIYLALEGKAKTFVALSESEQNLDWLDSALLCYRLITEVENLLYADYFGESSKFLHAEASHKRAEMAIRIAYRLLQVRQDQKYAQQAYYFMEHSKAAFLKEIFQEIDAQTVAHVPDSVSQQEKKRIQDLKQAEIRMFEAISEEASEQELAPMRLEYADAMDKYSSWVQHIQQTYPTYYALTHLAEQTPLPELERTLIQDSLSLMHYFVSEQEIFVLLLSPDQVQLYRNELPFDLSREVDSLRIFLRKLAQGNPSDLEQFIQKARQIYTAAWIPANMASERLLIIPDGPLHLLPFEVLLTSSVDNATPIQEYPYLLFQHQVSLASSVTTWLDMRHRPKTSAQHSFLAVTPESFSDPMLATFKDNGVDHQSIVEIWDGEMLAGPQATKSGFQSIAAMYNIIHLFTHAKADDSFPALSSIYFQAEEHDTVDQILKLGEILNLDLDADLVALPTCQSLVGKILTGEGTNSLARAFGLAGCKSLIATLDDVHYQSGLSIMGRFYHYLAQGFPKDKALRQAKLDYLRQSESIQGVPSMWANYILIGDYSQVSRHQAGWNPWTIAFISLTISLLFFCFIFFKK
ncbi:MAG: CHAT domain-containing protein [Bacteroidota bacterium]